MKSIDIFYQGDGITTLEHIEVDEATTFAALHDLIAKKLGIDDGSILYIEDEDEPADGKDIVGKKASRAGIKVHVHRCKKIAVSVHFKDKTVRDDFAPGTTIARIKRWAAVRKFGMTEEEASDHHLQLTGTTDQPDPGTHVGTLTRGRKCEVAFDLVTTPKVNGADACS